MRVGKAHIEAPPRQGAWSRRGLDAEEREDLFLTFLDLHNLPATVDPAVGAHSVGHPELSTVGTLRELRCADPVVVGASMPSPHFRSLSLWNRHFSRPSLSHLVKVL